MVFYLILQRHLFSKIHKKKNLPDQNPDAQADRLKFVFVKSVLDILAVPTARDVPANIINRHRPQPIMIGQN